eukprot:Gb_04049 [translate_table: standard]
MINCDTENRLKNDLIKPTVEGTLKVMRACTKAKSVKRLVITSSVARTALNGLEEQNGIIVDESGWTGGTHHQTGGHQTLANRACDLAILWQPNRERRRALQSGNSKLGDINLKKNYCMEAPKIRKRD